MLQDGSFVKFKGRGYLFKTLQCVLEMCEEPLNCFVKSMLKFKGAVSYFTHKVLLIANLKALGQRFQV